MIKVNLLKDQAAGTYKMFALPTMSKSGLIYVAIFLLAIGSMGTWSLYMHRQVKTVIEKRSMLRVKEADLQKLKKEIDKYQEMKQLLQTRIEAIEQLKKSRTGPVVLLNTILQSIPQNGNLWLISLNQMADSIKIDGFAQRADSIPDLMSNLIASGIFSAVDLDKIERQEEASKFSLLCKSFGKSPGEQISGR